MEAGTGCRLFRDAGGGSSGAACRRGAAHFPANPASIVSSTRLANFPGLKSLRQARGRLLTLPAGLRAGLRALDAAHVGNGGRLATRGDRKGAPGCVLLHTACVPLVRIALPAIVAMLYAPCAHHIALRARCNSTHGCGDSEFTVHSLLGAGARACGGGGGGSPAQQLLAARSHPSGRPDGGPGQR